MIRTINDLNEILSEDYKIVIIYFSQNINPYYEQLTYKYNLNCLFHTIEDMNIIHKCNIKHLPTYKIYYKGREIKTVYDNLNEVELYINKIINIIQSKKSNSSC